jgi:outer membrane protein
MCFMGLMLAGAGHAADNLLDGSRTVDEPPVSGTPAVNTSPASRVIITADPRIIQQARELLAAKRAQEAYQLLAPHEYEWAGDRDFDYLLGTAALDSGRNSEAVLSLQRALATDPHYSAARMELARAYYNLGDYDQAAAEFRQLQLESPPDYARRVIENYLLAIDQRASGMRPNFQYFVEFDGGYDTNANGSTSDNSFLGFTLDDRNVEQNSAFFGFAHGGIWTNPLTPELTNYNQFGFNHRRNLSADFVNSDRLSAATSLTWRQGGTSLNGTLGAYLLYLDSSFPFGGDKNSHGATLDLGARQALGERWLLGADIRHGQVRYEDIEVRDVDQTIYALSLEHFFADVRQLRVGATLIGGKEDATESNSPFGRDQAGYRVSASWLMSPIARSYLYAGSLKSDYDGLFFGAKREDTQRTLGWYLVWRVFPSQNWALVPRFSYTDNDSDIALYEYDRTEVGLSIRWLSD